MILLQNILKKGVVIICSLYQNFLSITIIEEVPVLFLFFNSKWGNPLRNLMQCYFYLNYYHSDIFSSKIYNYCPMQMNFPLLSYSHN